MLPLHLRTGISKCLDTCYPGYTCETNNLDFALYFKKVGITGK